jgi:epoxyqueuosine reductase
LMDLVTSTEVKEFARSRGVSLVGVTTAERIRDLPTGSISGVKTLRAAAEELPSVRSVIVLAHHVWDPIFNVACDPRFRGNGTPYLGGGSEWYQLYAEVTTNKAWQVVEYLKKFGHEATVPKNSPFKLLAVEAGLGCQGKNTLVITPEYGPDVRFSAVLTSAELEPDEPFTEELCGDCDRCIASCPTKALHPHEIDIRRCLNYAVENPQSLDVDEDVRALEEKLIKRPTQNSYIECAICQDACPMGRGS